MRFVRSTMMFTVLLALLCISLPAGAKEGPQKLHGPHVKTAVKKTRAVKKASFPMQGNHDYLIGPEDVIEISVWKNSALSKTVKVRPDGKISLPLIGDVQAARLTPKQLRKAIEKNISKYQQTAIVSVIVIEVNSYRIFVLGEVATPGAYQMRTRTSVLQAIALAGGFTKFASKNKMKLIRTKKDGSGDEKITIRFKDLVYKKDTHENIILKPGDTIFVP